VHNFLRLLQESNIVFGLSIARTSQRETFLSSAPVGQSR